MPTPTTETDPTAGVSIGNVPYRKTVFLPRALLDMAGMPVEGHGAPVEFTESLLVPQTFMQAAWELATGRTIELEEVPPCTTPIPLKVEFNIEQNGRPGPALNTDHLRCLCLLLAFPVTASGATIATRAEFVNAFRGEGLGVADSRIKQYVGKLLLDIHDIWCRITMPQPDGTAQEAEFKILDSFSIHSLKRGTRLLRRQWQSLRITLLFRELIASLATTEGQGRLIPVFVPSFLQLGSDLAARICLYASAPAYHHPANDPFRIRTKLLWERAGLNCPRPAGLPRDAKAPRKERKKASVAPTRYAAYRKQLLTQHKQSVLDMLNGVLIGRGDTTLHVRLEPTADGEDYNLVIWSVTANEARAKRLSTDSPMGKFKAAWLATGKTEAAYLAALKPPRPLSEYDIERLTVAGIDPKPCLGALRIAKSLLAPTRWDGLISEAKAETIEGSDTREPVRLLMYRLVQAVAGK